MAGGRPSKFNDMFPGMAAKLAEEGKTNTEIAEFFEVSERTFYRWLQRSDELCQSLNNGKEFADDMVEASLFKRAVGFTVPETKVFCTKDGDIVEHELVKQYAPDTTACIFWLKNRRKSEWGESAEGDGKLEINLNYTPKSKREPDDSSET